MSREPTEFEKHDPSAPPGFFEAEAEGLRWLAQAGCVAVPAVLGLDRHRIVIERIETGQASAQGAERFGRDLAALHATGAPSFGAPWPGFIGPLPMDNSPCPDWATFYVERRVLPFLRQARDAESLSAAQAASIEAVLPALGGLPGADEGPSRLHGDLWHGNLLFDRRGAAWLIDPSAHGGHRESDLAMLALFGAPYLERILAAYDEQRALALGWRERVGLHQLYPLLVHAVLFGPPYGARAAVTAEAARALT